MSLPLATLSLGHLYVKLDILPNDEWERGSCHIVTSSFHNTIQLNFIWKHCSRHLSKFKHVRYTKEKFQTYYRVTTDFL